MPDQIHSGRRALAWVDREDFAEDKIGVGRDPCLECGHAGSYTKDASKSVVLCRLPPLCMLRLTKKADYGLMALKFLAEHPEVHSQSAKDIAEAYGIPPQLLAKILQRLTKVGLLRSHAGINGGYSLSRDAGSITAFEVIHAIDGPLFITSCGPRTGSSRSCDLLDSCTIKEPLSRVNDSISDVLKAIRIADLVDAVPFDRRNHGKAASLKPGSLEPQLVSLG